MMPMDCSIVLHIEVLTAVYVKSVRMTWLKVITRTMDATQALFTWICISEAVWWLRRGGIGEDCNDVQNT